MANLDVMYSSKTDQWATPLDFFQEINAEFGFDLDPCADEENHKCERYFTKEQNGLLQDWGGAGCFAILPMAKKLVHGLRKHTMKATKRARWWLCSYRPGQIPSIFMISSCTGQRCDL